MNVRRLPGRGWLVLVGGGEFTFGETVEADRAWEAKAEPGRVGFLPTASGSEEYGGYFTSYLGEGLGREVEVIPVYRPRDARRGKNIERIEGVAAVYIGGGVSDHLLQTLAGSPAAAALSDKLGEGGVVVAIAAAAQALGRYARGLDGVSIEGLGWLPGAVVEPNFDPAHDRRLRQLMAAPGVELGLGLPAGSAILLGPEGEAEIVGLAFALSDEDGDYEVLGSR